MTSVTFDPMSEALFSALPHLKPDALSAFTVEGQDTVEESPYLVFSVVPGPHLDDFLDQTPSTTRDAELRCIFAFFEAFIADPQWSSGGYNYADNLIGVQILERLMGRGYEERLRRARSFMGPLVSHELAEMERHWEEECTRRAALALAESKKTPLGKKWRKSGSAAR